ncbi:MAG: PSP1 domain-containing protein [Patescibacteria group bacterium]
MNDQDEKKLVVGLRFISGLKIYHYDPNGGDWQRGDYVVVENQQGEELAKVVYPKKEISKSQLEDTELLKVIRLATEDDKKNTILFFKEKKQYLEEARNLAKSLKLLIKFIDVSKSLEESGRLLFLFAADGRVDFRDLLTRMSKKFNCPIRLYQIGPRDTARMIGGVGVCGQQLCCHRFLTKFESITMDMAREQDMLSVGSNKISGVCGKLLCCLEYELEIYKKLKKGMPPLYRNVMTNDKQTGKIIERNVLMRTVTLEMENGSKKTYAVEDVKLIDDVK